MNDIVFPKIELWNTLIDHILKDNINETAATVLCKLSKSNNQKRFIVHELMLPEKKDLIRCSGVSVTLSPEFMDSVYKKCIEKNLHPIDIHDHPFSKSKVGFSWIDTNQQKHLLSYSKRWFTGLEFGFMVIGTDASNIDAHILNPKLNTIEPVDKIKVLDSDKMKLIIPNSSELKKDSGFNFSQRTILAVGKAAQKKYSCLTVAIIGDGGLGCTTAEQFSRLEVRKIILVDNDHITESNRNRFLGATPEDAKNNHKKVEVTKQHLLKSNPNLEIEALVGDFLTADIQEKCKEADIIIGCVDGVGARYAINRFAQAHAIPYFDSGCGGKTKDGLLNFAQGQILKIIPNTSFCIQCGEFFSKEKARRDLLSTRECETQSNLGYIEGANIPQASVYSWNMITAASLVWLVMRYVSGDCHRVDGIAIDLMTFSSWTWREDIDDNGKIKKANNCSVCSENGYSCKGDEVPFLLRQPDIIKLDQPLDKLEKTNILKRLRGNLINILARVGKFLKRRITPVH